MNAALIFVAGCSLAFAQAVVAQATIQTGSLSAPLTAHDAHRLMNSAQSIADYKQLANYFHSQEAVYRAEAAKEKVDFDQLAKVNPYRYLKYPRPVDSARYSYELSTTRSERAGLRAAHYEQLAAAQTRHDQQLSTALPGKS